MNFTVKPAATSDHVAVEMFGELLLRNVCNGNEDHFRWVMGWFASMFQTPKDKPGTALVLTGPRGCGKSFVVETVGRLLANHFLEVTDDRFMQGNYNGPLEETVLMVLGDVSWAGNEYAEARLKGIITGSQHRIERRMTEPKVVPNFTRVAILSQDWCVPVGQGERRFAVFHMTRATHPAFFRIMREGLEDRGGAAHLLRYLLDFDLSSADLSTVPVIPAAPDYSRLPTYRSFQNA